MTTKIRHVAVYTENYDRMAKFYQTLFGMKKITSGMTDETGTYNPNRGHLSDGVVGLALLQRQPGIRSGLDHFGFEVDDVQAVLKRLEASYPDIVVARSQEHVPFAGLRGHDPSGNQFDLSQKGMANVREGYLQEGWTQPRWLNHIAIRAAKPALLAEFYRNIFELAPVETAGNSNSFVLTDGRVSLVIRPWDMASYRGLWEGLDHVGFKVESLEQARKELEDMATSFPESAPRKIAVGRDGAKRQKNLEACQCCKQAISDPDGVLVDLTD